VTRKHSSRTRARRRTKRAGRSSTRKS
jgi:hypothetical protein